MDTAMEEPGVPATSPSMEDLGGGSPELFGKAFQDAIAGSEFPPTSEYAAAAQLEEGETLTIGFIYVGSRQDLGYNQAAYEGRLALEENIPGLKILDVENIPETAEVQRVAKQLINQGAHIIFPTSYGYSGPIKDIVDDHPEVVFLHQGDVDSRPNYGTYFGNIWQLEYASGIVAGSMTESNKLGFIAAFPIPQTLLNVNAFHLGAKSVNPDIETTFVLTSDWCDPAKQAATVQTMIDAGIDVITQHQDCTKTIIEAAEREGIYVTGYHHDSSASAPNSWLTGAVWNWGPIYTELVAEIMQGTYRTSSFLAGLEAGWVKLAPFGSAVPEDVRELALKAVEDIRSGVIHPFTGPVLDQDGNVLFAEGEVPTDEELQGTDWLVEGVQGSTQ
jgi:basic membrane lipoprotein Med (substrate-binding protein (PBP1-ABC) superfamily)